MPPRGFPRLQASATTQSARPQGRYTRPDLPPDKLEVLDLQRSSVADLQDRYMMFLECRSYLRNPSKETALNEAGCAPNVSRCRRRSPKEEEDEVSSSGDDELSTIGDEPIWWNSLIASI